jgi:hypothetical protein
VIELLRHLFGLHPHRWEDTGEVIRWERAIHDPLAEKRVVGKAIVQRCTEPGCGKARRQWL